MKTKRFDLPGSLAAFGTMLVLGGAVSLFWPSEVVPRDSLISVSGRVASVGFWKRGANEQLRINVAASDRVHHFSQDYDLLRSEPKLAGIRARDEVVVLVHPDGLWRDIDWLYEIKRGDQVLLEYEQTSAYLLRRETRARTVFSCGGVLGIVFLIASWFSRRHYSVRNAT